MNTEEAVRIVEEWLARFQSEPYAKLVSRIDAESVVEEITCGDKP
jgi:hypothetical protein